MQKSSQNTIATPHIDFVATLPEFPFLHNQEFIFLSKATAYVLRSAPLLRGLLLNNVIFYPQATNFMHF